MTAETSGDQGTGPPGPSRPGSVTVAGKHFALIAGNAFRGLEVGEMAERERQIAVEAVYLEF